MFWIDLVIYMHCFKHFFKQASKFVKHESVLFLPEVVDFLWGEIHKSTFFKISTQLHLLIVVICWLQFSSNPLSISIKATVGLIKAQWHVHHERWCQCFVHRSTKHGNKSCWLERDIAKNHTHTHAGSEEPIAQLLRRVYYPLPACDLEDLTLIMESVGVALCCS